MEENELLDFDENNLTLTDIIDTETLQEMQDSFCEMTGINAGVADLNGIAVTKPTIPSEFCLITKASPIGLKRCEKCDHTGGRMAYESGQPVCYKCHAGLVDFAAPIIANGRMIGSFIGGQVLTEDPDLDHIRQVAAEINVDPDKYVESVKKIKILDKETLNKYTNFLYTLAKTLSKIGVHGYTSLHTAKELERVAHMKSDFLANMSHEIRTPMNAVIGMAELALREELPPVARDYINQIKSSGNTLLAIINDILDFSKIESGKMSIVPVDYIPMSIINDISNTILTRIGDKPIDLIFDINPNIPYELTGDTVRIKQILINIANNAVKFTKSGLVKITMDFDTISDTQIDLKFSVEDTGIGMKKEDLGKLFNSFQQLDSKRNRNIEGTGLGLAIVKQLLTLMGGDIYVESEYEKGSKFTFSFPQTVTDKKPSIGASQKSITAACLTDDEPVLRQLEKDVMRMGGNYISVTLDNCDSELLDKNVNYFFIEEAMFTSSIEQWVRNHPDITAVLMINFNSSSKHSDIPNLKVIKKPMYILNLATIFNGENFYEEYSYSTDDTFKFTAPTADVLLVDDNAINLTVAQGLLEPLKMNIDTALSGMECISKISVKHYDIIFMDHMMPELDGIETTRIIRRFHSEYNDVPIIALTANAVEGTKEMFLSEGMNDFVAKPIELRIIVSVLKKWLPEIKIVKITDSPDTVNVAEAPVESPLVSEMDFLDVKASLKLLGGEKLFMSVLKDYYKVIDKKTSLIKDYEQAENWPSYTIEVHALKSASRQIGAMELSNMAADMEKAGNAQNAISIHKTTPKLLELYQHLKYKLEPFFPENTFENIEKRPATADELATIFAKINEALDNLDMDQMEEATTELKQFEYDEQSVVLLKNLLEAAEEWDVDKCMEILSEWVGIL